MVEVAQIISKLWDVAGTGEHRRKGGAPKEGNVCSFVLGHSVNSRMTVRSAVRGWRAIGMIKQN